MNLAKAFEIVLGLACENFVDDDDKDLTNERRQQLIAIGLVYKHYQHICEEETEQT